MELKEKTVTTIEYQYDSAGTVIKSITTNEYYKNEEGE